MIITRTETYTDWIFQSAHANEVAATVGRGLLKGHIYFRYAYDILKEGDTVDREVSHVHLSDGSVYELGTGLSSEKITIVYHGLTSDGSVYISVDGHMGVGVSSITRTLTISYDDGKVPVLDTEQLNGMLGELKGSLTESMTNTANAVKEELRSELNTKLIDLNDHVGSTLTKHTAEMKQVISSGDDALSGRITSVESALTSKVSTVETTLKESIEFNKTFVLAKIGSKIKMGQWAIGQYTVGSGMFNNVLSAEPSFMGNGDDAFKWNSDKKSLKLDIFSSDESHRILRVAYTGNVDIPEGYNGYLSMTIRNTAGGTLARQMIPLLRSNSMLPNVENMQFYVELFIPKGDHPIYTDGVRIEFGNNGPNGVVLRSGAALSMTLLTA